jgi:hypothetical protein
MTDLELPHSAQREAGREAAAAAWTVYAPRVASVATLAVVSAWVHKLGGVSSSKDVGADGSISTDRCVSDCYSCMHPAVHTAVILWYSPSARSVRACEGPCKGWGGALL